MKIFHHYPSIKHHQGSKVEEYNCTNFHLQISNISKRGNNCKSRIGSFSLSLGLRRSSDLGFRTMGIDRIFALVPVITIFLFATHVRGFYLPGVAPEDFQQVRLRFGSGLRSDLFVWCSLSRFVDLVLLLLRYPAMGIVDLGFR